MATRSIIMTAAFCLAIAVAGGCERAERVAPAPEHKSATQSPVLSGATLALTIVEQSSEEVVVELRHQPREGEALPRLMELHLRLSDNLSLLSASRGAAAEAVGKDLVVKEKEGNVLRALLFSAQNVKRLGEGELARFRLKRSDTGSAKVELLDKMPVFAPPEANEGLLLADPLEIPAP
jgi:hypothetical protein